MTNKAKIINVVSGKGGTGKTLLLTVLAKSLGALSRVLIIDLDIFVRGLSTIYYRELHEPNSLMAKDQLPVSTFFLNKHILPSFVKQMRERKTKPGIQTHGNYDIWPAVMHIKDKLPAQDLIPNNLFNAISLIESLLDFINKDYDYIFLDNRAGFDELIAAAHLVSTCSLCIDEDDNIANITADILIEQLLKMKTPRTDPSYDTILDTLSTSKDLIHTCINEACPESANNISPEQRSMMEAYRVFTNASDNFQGELYKVKLKQDTNQNDTVRLRVDNDKKVFRIFNKCRNPHNRSSSKVGILIGAIPFDADVMENFGKDTFDLNLNRSKYKEALCRAWNTLLVEMEWDKRHKIQWFESNDVGQNIEGALFILTKPRRYLFLSGFIITLLSSMLLLLDSGLAACLELIQDPARLPALLFMIIGILFLICAPINFNILFKRNKKDSPRRPKQ